MNISCKLATYELVNNASASHICLNDCTAVHCSIHCLISHATSVCCMHMHMRSMHCPKPARHKLHDFAAKVCRVESKVTKTTVMCAVVGGIWTSANLTDGVCLQTLGGAVLEVHTPVSCQWILYTDLHKYSITGQ